MGGKPSPRDTKSHEAVQLLIFWVPGFTRHPFIPQTEIEGDDYLTGLHDDQDPNRGPIISSQGRKPLTASLSGNIFHVVAVCELSIFVDLDGKSLSHQTNLLLICFNLIFTLN